MNNNPYYIKIKGIIYDVYVDENKQKHKVKLICPHLKCNLIFNTKEKTWDCPCHGSRFDIDGKLIYGPSTKNIEIIILLYIFHYFLDFFEHQLLFDLRILSILM